MTENLDLENLTPPERLPHTVRQLQLMGQPPPRPITVTGRPEAAKPTGFLDPLWERQPNEPAYWFQCFLIYADLLPADRTMAEAWRRWQRINNRNEKAPISHSWIFKARQWQWADRALARDQARMEAIRQSWPNLDMERRRNEYEAGEKLRLAALERLAEVNPESLSPALALKMLALASKLQATALSGIRPQASEVKQLIKQLPEAQRQQLLGILAARLGADK